VSYAKAPIAPVNSSWAGFYLGAHGGYGWGQDNFSNGVLVSTPSPIPLIDGPRSQGGIGGGQAGFNWQYDRVVTGIEADFSVSSIRGASNLAFPDGVGDIDIESRSDSVKYLGTLRGRVGWLPVSNVLVYGTAGLAWERLEQTTTDITPIETQVITQPSDRFGWVAGVGVESMVSGTNWIGRLEYLHYDFGTVASVVTDTTVPLFEHGGKQTSDVLRAGLSYKFGPSAASSSVPYTKAPPLSMASWAGFYLGVHGGYGWNDDDFTVVVVPSPLATIGSIKSQGAVGGGQAGYNWQNGSVVGGFELDVSATSSNGTSQTGLITVPGATESASFSDNVNYLGTARARLGWTPSQNVLLYGTGGLAWERVERTQISTITSGAVIDMQTERDAHDFFGWAAGIGAETMLFGPNWIGRLEYLHYDFGKVQPVQTVISNTPLLPSGSDRAGRQTIDVIRAGISYKFSADGPIVARY
jgi:outer membrane immunogenic protein